MEELILGLKLYVESLFFKLSREKYVRVLLFGKFGENEVNELIWGLNHLYIGLSERLNDIV